MSNAPVFFRSPGVDPTLDEIPLRRANIRPLVTCGVIVLFVLVAACGAIAFIAAQSSSNNASAIDITEAVLPTETPTPDDWSATGTAIANSTATFTPTATSTPTNTPDDWSATGTALYLATYTATATFTPTETFTPTPTPEVTLVDSPQSRSWLYQFVFGVDMAVQRARAEAALLVTPTQTPTQFVTQTPYIIYRDGQQQQQQVIQVTVPPQIIYREGEERIIYITQQPQPTLVFTWIPLPTALPTLAPTLTLELPTTSPTATIPATATLAPPTATHTETPIPDSDGDGFNDLIDPCPMAFDPVTGCPPTATATATFTPTYTPTPTETPALDVTQEVT